MNRSDQQAETSNHAPVPPHEELRIVRGSRSGVPIAVAIHSTAAGPATGGCRIKPYPTWQQAIDDVLQLSEAMTTKCALAGLPHGGGKAVAMLPADTQPVARAGLIADIADVVASFQGRYIIGPDIGTGPDDMAAIHAAAGGWAYCRPESAGGSGNSSLPTARGVLASLGVAVERVFKQVGAAGLRAGVIGYGHVGSLVANALALGGADVWVYDVNESVAPDVDTAGMTWWSQPSLADELDILVPAAAGGLLTPSTAETCGAGLIVGPANNQITGDRVDEILHHRGITWVPDVLASGGGVAYAVSRETLGLNEADSNARVDAIGQTTTALFAQMDQDNSTPLKAARRLAARRIVGAA